MAGVCKRLPSLVYTYLYPAIRGWGNHVSFVPLRNLPLPAHATINVPLTCTPYSYAIITAPAMPCNVSNKFPISPSRLRPQSRKRTNTSTDLGLLSPSLSRTRQVGLLALNTRVRALRSNRLRWHPCELRYGIVRHLHLSRY